MMCFSTVWHPRCGPCPSGELGGVLNGGTSVLAGHAANGHATDTDCDRLSNSAMSEMQVSFMSGDDFYDQMLFSTSLIAFCIIFFVGSAAPYSFFSNYLTKKKFLACFVTA